jgi:hypothetical protein
MSWAEAPPATIETAAIQTAILRNDGMLPSFAPDRNGPVRKPPREARR